MSLGYSQRHHFLTILLSLSLAVTFNLGVLPAEAKVYEVDETNAEDLFKGSWLVMFHAPWCPACNALAEPWQALAADLEAAGLSTKLARVDVSENPGLNGRFLVFSLPSIYKLDDGECRQYIGQYNSQAVQQWVEGGAWRSVDAVPAWKSPDSLLLKGVGHFFRFASALRALKTQIEVEYGLPFWVVYCLFFVATVVLGACVGMMVICFLDCLGALLAGKKSKETSSAEVKADARDGSHDKQEEKTTTKNADKRQSSSEAAGGAGSGQGDGSARKRRKNKKHK